MSVLFIIFLIVFILLFALIILGIARRPILPSISITPGSGGFNNTCKKEKVACNTDYDCLKKCSEAQEGEEMVCKAIPDIPNLTPTQQKMFGASGVSAPNKYCVPSKSKINCNVATGGIPVFSGWSGAERMEFDCMCSYPVWASSRVCDRDTGACEGNCLLNPGICEGGTFRWDLTKKAEEPIAGLCECADGAVMVVDNSGLPHCVPEHLQTFYSDLDVSTGSRGGQNLIEVDNVPMKNFMPSSCSATGISASQTTKCGDACCPTPDAVCCGTSGCCPPNFPVCDVANGKCLKSVNSCDSGETKCSGGCCNIPNGVCCPGGNSCCPANFPLCDPDTGFCNPYPTPLETGDAKTCKLIEDTQCANGCCPFPDGVCCGGLVKVPNGTGSEVSVFGCCPSEYPVCDLENSMCRKPKAN